MTNIERRVEELKEDIRKLRKMLKGSGMNRSTLHNVKFNAQEQTSRYDMTLELADKEEELEDLEKFKIKEDFKK